MAIYDVYFMPVEPMVIAVEADSPEEAADMVQWDDGEILDKNTLVDRFLSSLEWNDEYEITGVYEVDD